jgi:Porin subfamily
MERFSLATSPRFCSAVTRRTPASTTSSTPPIPFGIRGAFNHNWNEYWSSSLFGSYSAVRYNGSVGDVKTAKGAYCQAYIGSTGGLATKSADFNCNPDFNVSQLGVVTRWTPVKNLTFSAEVQWFQLDQKFAGASTLTPTAPKPTAVYEYNDQDTVLPQVRAQRNF